jgi:hypothetical protein
VLISSGIREKRTAQQPPPTTQEVNLGMALAPKEIYPSSDPYDVVLFDVRIPDVAERLQSERAAWKESGDIEALDEDHFVLIVRPGGVKRWAA